MCTGQSLGVATDQSYLGIPSNRTYRERTLSLDGDHQYTFSIRDDLFADLGCFRTEVGASNDTKLYLAIDDECEADGELLVSNEA